MNLKFSRHIFEKYFSYFVTISLVGGELFHWDRRTDRHDERNGRFSPFCVSTQKEKNLRIHAVLFPRFLYLPLASLWHICVMASNK